MLRVIFAVCLATAPLIVAGQSMIYKVQMPDGSVLYSDNVPSGGKVLEEREAKSTPRVNVQPVQPGRGAPPTQTAVTRPGVPPSAVMRPSIPTKGAAPPVNIETLERELATAKRRLELGREPLPGERRGLAGGGSRLTEEYEARIAGLEREVAMIEAKLMDAYAKR
jgi:hypothetical protein